MKRINEVFSDFNTGSNISTALVESAVLKKKSKTLELAISSDRYIEIQEIEELNNFIKRRFYLEHSKIAVNYTEEVKMKPIEEEIKNIISYVSNKHPFLRVAVNNCDYEISGNTITLKFRVPVNNVQGLKV